MTDEQRSDCDKIAEFLDAPWPTTCPHCGGEDFAISTKNLADSVWGKDEACRVLYCDQCGEDVKQLTMLDFYASESASAKLLDAMPSPTLWKWERGWHCHADVMDHADDAISPDRKTAIVNAMLAFIAKSQKEQP